MSEAFCNAPSPVSDAFWLAGKCFQGFVSRFQVLPIDSVMITSLFRLPYRILQTKTG